MKNHSTGRRIAGRGLIAAAAIALPLTASVTYAEVTTSDVPAPPAAPTAPVAPPAPPAPPAPDVAFAPPAPPVPAVTFQSAAEAPEIEKERHVERHVYVSRDVDTDGEGKRVRKIKIHEGEGLTKEEIEEIMVEVKEGLAEADIAIAEAHKIAIEMANEAGEHHFMVEMSCDGDDMVSESISEDGKKVMKICKTHIMASALEGLREARRELAENEELSGDIRQRVLDQLDAQIAEWEKRGS